MKIIEEINNKDPQGNWTEYEPRPRTDQGVLNTIAQLRRFAVKDKSIILDMRYRIKTINNY